MKSITLLTAAAICTSVLSAQAATLAHRYAFNADGDTTDSVGGNTGILVNGATVVAGAGGLQLPGTGTGLSAASMSFSALVGIGSNFGASGVTIETWYTDTGSGTWAKLFSFSNDPPSPGFELAYTNVRGGPVEAGIDRDGAKLMGPRPSLGVEHHLAVTVSSDGNLNTWVDGIQILTNIDTNDLVNVSSQVERIGATAWNDPGHLGSVNEFRIWSGELTGAEVNQNISLGPNQLVPEPAGIALAGLGAMLLLRRRRV